MNYSSQYFLLLLSLIIWDAVWKGIALWKSARNKHSKWFIALLLINSIGIIPIIYINFFQKKKNGVVNKKKLIVTILGELMVILFFVLMLRFTLGGDEDTWICVNNQWVKHGNPTASIPQTACK